jgi:hypothetical protein
MTLNDPQWSGPGGWKARTVGIFKIFEMPKQEGDDNDSSTDDEEGEVFDYSISGEKVPDDLFSGLDPDFGTLFARKANEEDEEGEFFLSPRMAHKLYCSALYLSDTMYLFLKMGNAENYLMSDGYPEVFWPFFRQEHWVDAYSECYRRIAARLAKVRFLLNFYDSKENALLFF